MGAVLCADAAMVAYQWLLLFFIEAYRINQAGRLAAAATHAQFFVHCDAPAFTQEQGIGGAIFRASGFAAGIAHHVNELAGHAAIGKNFNAAFFGGVVPPVDGGANKHAREAADAS